MKKSKNCLTAVGLSMFGGFLVGLAFITKCWLVTDGELEQSEFDRIGLWVVCFKGLQDSHHWYDTKLYGCRWVFAKEHKIISEDLFQSFYIATQIWFTLCVFLTLCGILYASYKFHQNQTIENYVNTLFTTGGIFLTGAVCGSIALTIFGIYGDSRAWMPHWEHNDIGWSYAIAVAGTISFYISGMLYIIEGRVYRMQLNRVGV